MYRQSHPRGIALIWVVVLMLVFAGFVGLAIDTFYTVYTAQQLQVGGDAAALAGAALVRRNQDSARDAAINIAAENLAGGSALALQRNGDNLEDGDIVIGHYSREEQTFTATTTLPNAVKVIAPRNTGSSGGPLALFFGPTFGKDTAEVKRNAIGMVGGDVKLGIIALNATERSAFDIRGTAFNLVVNGGGIQVNSSHPESAASHAGQPTIDALEMFISGGTDNNWDQVAFDGETYTSSPPVPDPFADLPEPNYLTTLPIPGITVGNTTTYAPGYHTGITQTASNKRLVFLPGLHIINGPFNVTGGNVTGLGVMLFIGPNGSVDLGGGGNITLTPLNPLVYPLGPSIPTELLDSRLVIFQDRGNTADARIIGTSSMDIEGRLYFPSNHIEIGGNGGAVGSGIVADTMEFYGTGTITIDSDISIIKDRFVFLVE